MPIEVVRGNCPCSLRLARELGIEVDLGCEGDGDGCDVAAFLDELPPAERQATGPDSDAEQRVALDPADLRVLFGNDLGDLFLLVTSPDIRETIRLSSRDGFPVEEISWEGPDTRPTVIQTFRELDAQGRRCSVLWTAADEFEHYLEEDLANVKLAAISFFSDSYSPDSLRRYLQIIGATDYDYELALEEKLLGMLENAERVIFRAPRFGTEATFDHHDAEHWFSLHGVLDWGQQTVLPTGELATLTDPSGEFRFESRFAVNGEIVLKGHPIVHRGNRGVTREETDSMYDALANMHRFGVVCRVTDGLIEEISSPTPGPNPLFAVIKSLFELDERYRKIHEIGFGTNAGCARMLARNFFANERWPGVHCGLGLGGFTPFHLDLACMEMDVMIQTLQGGIVDVYQELGLPRVREVRAAA